MVKFKCKRGHQWVDPEPTEEAPAMAKLFGICPKCRGKVKGEKV